MAHTLTNYNGVQIVTPEADLSADRQALNDNFRILADVSVRNPMTANLDAGGHDITDIGTSSDNPALSVNGGAITSLDGGAIITDGSGNTSLNSSLITGDGRSSYGNNLGLMLGYYIGINSENTAGIVSGNPALSQYQPLQMIASEFQIYAAPNSLGSPTDGHICTNNNTLDDGAGNATFAAKINARNLPTGTTSAPYTVALGGVLGDLWRNTTNNTIQMVIE